MTDRQGAPRQRRGVVLCAVLTMLLGAGCAPSVPASPSPSAGDASPGAAAAPSDGTQEAGSLVIESDPPSPRLLCAWCDTLEEATVRKVSLRGAPSRSERES